MQAFIESNFAWLWIVTNKQKKSIRWRTLFCNGKLPTGLEPVIYWLRINRSTNWATEALWTVLYYDTRGRGFCQEKNESSWIRLLFTHHVTKALRCNGFVAGQNSAGSFYALSYYTLLWKTCFKCPPRESHSPSGFAAILVSVNFNSEPYLSLKYSSGSKVRASAGVRWYTGGSK